MIAFLLVCDSFTIKGYVTCTYVLVFLDNLRSLERKQRKKITSYLLIALYG